MVIDPPDIDIDVKDRSEILDILRHVPASIHRPGKLEKHKSGVYFQSVPVDPITRQCSLDHKKAEEKGYTKIDLLHNHIYHDVKSPEHLDELAKKEPRWEFLEHKEIVQELFQLHNHFEIVKMMQPKSLEELAITIAIIRPGKKHLIGKPWYEIEREIWEKEQEGYQFKKSHAFAYALAIVVQLNLLEELMNE